MAGKCLRQVEQRNISACIKHKGDLAFHFEHIYSTRTDRTYRRTNIREVRIYQKGKSDSIIGRRAELIMVKQKKTKRKSNYLQSIIQKTKY